MTVNLTDSELKDLVKTHVNQLIGVPTDKLDVTFTRRSNQTDTAISILQEGEQTSAILTEPRNDSPAAEQSNISSILN